MTRQLGTEPTNQHYDLDPRIFQLMLGPTLKYSSALYPEGGASLDDAQRRKLQFVAAQLGLRGGERILDVGCGWGSLLFFMAETFGCHAVGVTPSGSQARFIRDRAAGRPVADRVQVVHARFQDVCLDAKAFDGVTLLGSIVHMDDPGRPLAECYRVLRTGGRLYLSESCFRSRAVWREFLNRPATVFVRDSIFGWGDMRPLSALIEAAEDAGFSLSALTDLTPHYYRTIEDWRANLARHRDDLERMAPGFAALDRYLEVANAGWGYTTKHYALVCTKRR